MDTIYINASEQTNDYLKVDFHTLLILNVYKLCDTDNINLRILIEREVTEYQFKVYIKSTKYEILNEIPKISRYCKWPVIVVGCTIVAGLCSVARQTIKSSSNENVQHFLGFREACLMACSESSIWTKFCEIDMIATVKEIVDNFNELQDGNELLLPKNLSRFENHMEQPVRIHNVYKFAREMNQNKDINSSVPLKDLNISHSYSEGPFITLADVLLYPCYSVIINALTEDVIKEMFPLSHAWFLRMHEISFIDFDSPKGSNFILKTITRSNTVKESLYSSDPNRYKPQNRIYTKQNDIERAINAITSSTLTISNDLIPFGCDMDFNWSNVPLEVNPEGGALPKKRSKRKCEQLENLAKAVVKLATNSGTSRVIVDFCSGSGHLGLLLATLLPDCEVILVENKERSLLRAKERIIALNLMNVILVQSNLDYFQANFNIGVSLHACGVATDLVIERCVKNNAHFIACPCCYGSIHNCYHLSYPRSKMFANLIDYNDYLHLSHASDQTHDKGNSKTNQGYLCMDIIDTDRKLYAECEGYEVFLGKLQPVSCTPKNNLIVGVFNK